MEKSTPFLVTVTGWSGSGKTTFCEKLIAELIRRGYKTAAAKNAHKNLQIDKAGSDSDRFYKSGAAAVCLNTENSLTVFYPKRIDDGAELLELFSDSDIIIAEGFKSGASFRIEVTGTIGDPAEMKNPAGDADIIVYGNPEIVENLGEAPGTSRQTALVDRDDISAAADIICGCT